MIQFRWYRWWRVHFWGARSFVRADPLCYWRDIHILIQGEDIDKVANLMKVTGYQEEWPRKEIRGSKTYFG